VVEALKSRTRPAGGVANDTFPEFHWFRFQRTKHGGNDAFVYWNFEEEACIASHSQQNAALHTIL
jgi:hypothetical protein